MGNPEYCPSHSRHLVCCRFLEIGRQQEGSASGSIASQMGVKIVASIVFLDFCIVAAITDKHRKYSDSYVIPIRK
jgi:hypothetical protein